MLVPSHEPFFSVSMGPSWLEHVKDPSTHLEEARSSKGNAGIGPRTRIEGNSRGQTSRQVSQSPSSSKASKYGWHVRPVLEGLFLAFIFFLLFRNFRLGSRSEPGSSSGESRKTRASGQLQDVLTALKGLSAAGSSSPAKHFPGAAGAYTDAEFLGEAALKQGVDRTDLHSLPSQSVSRERSSGGVYAESESEVADPLSLFAGSTQAARSAIQKRTKDNPPAETHRQKIAGKAYTDSESQGDRELSNGSPETGPEYEQKATKWMAFSESREMGALNQGPTQQSRLQTDSTLKPHGSALSRASATKEPAGEAGESQISRVVEAVSEALGNAVSGGWGEQVTRGKNAGGREQEQAAAAAAASQPSDEFSLRDLLEPSFFEPDTLLRSGTHGPGPNKDLICVAIPSVPRGTTETDTAVAVEELVSALSDRRSKITPVHYSLHAVVYSAGCPSSEGQQVLLAHEEALLRAVRKATRLNSTVVRPHPALCGLMDRPDKLLRRMPKGHLKGHWLWRTKETIDFAYVIRQCLALKPEYVLFLEDDTWPVKGYDYGIQHVLDNDLASQTWHALSLYYPSSFAWRNRHLKTRYNFPCCTQAILLPAAEAMALVGYVEDRFTAKPVDWLIRDFLERSNKTGLAHIPSLFQHQTTIPSSNKFRASGGRLHKDLAFSETWVERRYHIKV